MLHMTSGNEEDISITLEPARSAPPPKLYLFMHGSLKQSHCEQYYAISGFFCVVIPGRFTRTSLLREAGNRAVF